jgi:hypothetical protein
MALQSSGQISMGDINVELGRTRTAIILDTKNGYVTINASTNKPSANKATISEWYSYNHSGVTDTPNSSWYFNSYKYS